MGQGFKIYRKKGALPQIQIRQGPVSALEGDSVLLSSHARHYFY